MTTIVNRYQDTSEFQKKTAHAPTSEMLRWEVAYNMYRAETGNRYRNWIGELAQYL